MEKPLTASAIISFAQKFEDDSSVFYEELAKTFLKNKEVFLAYAQESKKNRLIITRTYQETITDAIEACFSFEGLDLGDYLVEKNSTRDLSQHDTLQLAIGLERKAVRFYSNAAEQSKLLLATIPRAFRKVSEIRERRRLRLESMLARMKQ